MARPPGTFTLHNDMAYQAFRERTGRELRESEWWYLNIDTDRSGAVDTPEEEAAMDRWLINADGRAIPNPDAPPPPEGLPDGALRLSDDRAPELYAETHDGQRLGNSVFWRQNIDINQDGELDATEEANRRNYMITASGQIERIPGSPVNVDNIWQVQLGSNKGAPNYGTFEFNADNTSVDYASVRETLRINAERGRNPLKGALVHLLMTLSPDVGRDGYPMTRAHAQSTAETLINGSMLILNSDDDDETNDIEVIGINRLMQMFENTNNRITVASVYRDMGPP